MKNKKLRGLTYEEKAVQRVISKRHCNYCKTTENLTIDHMVAKKHGGKNKVSNYQCLCEECNQIKSDLSHKQVLRYFKWFLSIQKKREEAGKNKYTLR